MSRSRLLFALALLSILLLSFAGAAQAQSTPDSTSSDGTIGVRKILHNGQTFSDEFETGVTAYLYAFLASKGDSVTVSMVQKADSDLNPFLVLMGPHGEMIASDDDSGTDVFGSALISNKELPDDGVYLVMATTSAHIDEILIENGSVTAEPSDQTFDITVAGINDPASTDQALIYTKDMAKGDSLDGESTLDSPVGYYTYEGKAGDVINISATSIEENDAYIDTILHVFDPDGRRIAVNDNASDSTTDSAIQSLTLTEDGTYMILATDIFFYEAGVKDSILTFDGGKYTISVS